MHDGGNDVRTARTAACRQSESNTRAHKHAAYNARHELLIGQCVDIHAEDVLKQRGGYGEDDDRIDGLGTEAPAEHGERGDEQQRIEQEIGVLHRYARTPVDDRGDTHDAARGDLVGHEKHVDADDTQEHGDGDDHIVAYGAIDRLTFSSFHSVVQ